MKSDELSGHYTSRCLLTSPAGHAIPPHPGPASTASLTPPSSPCTLIVTSDSGAVGGRIGTSEKEVRIFNEEDDEDRESDGEGGSETGISKD
jgi:hypothetical protein